MMQAYIAYGAEVLARQIADALCASDIDNHLETDIVAAELDEADVLVLAVETAEQLGALRTVWQYYLDALDWKRKDRGALVLVCPAPLKSAYVPFRLKHCLVFPDAQTLTDHLTELLATRSTAEQAQAAPRPAIETRIEAPAQIVYTPRVDAPKPPKERPVSSACKEDHVFEETARRQKDDADKKRANSSKPRGALGCLIAAIVFGIVAAALIINVLRILPF